MSSVDAITSSERSRPVHHGAFNYLDATMQSTLYRNGQVRIDRDQDGSDSQIVGARFDQREVPVIDGRSLPDAERPTLVANGFELTQRPLPGAVDFFDQHQVVHDYYLDCAALVSSATGFDAIAFDHNVRSATGRKAARRIDGGQRVQGPARVVHGDYTLTSAPQRLRDLGEAATGNDTWADLVEPGAPLIAPERVESVLESGRFSIINVWRSIVPEPVQAHPMAFCDAQTVEPEDLVVFEIHYADRIGENYFSKHADRHRWTTFPQMRMHEALLIKQWDSAGALARSQGRHGDHSDPTGDSTFSFHSAFDDPQAPDDAPDRWSIEVRCMVLDR